MQKEKKSLTYDSCDFITEIGNTLHMRLISQSTALVFFHRFYQNQTFEVHDNWIVSLACIFLAAKVEEDVKKLKDVILCGEALLQKQNNTKMREEGEEFKSISEKVLLSERILLHTLGFELSIQHPHNCMFRLYLIV